MSFSVYKSSAGSGKTFTLVFEYLKLALGSDNPARYREILAITFTNKSSNEMKERVIDYLKGITEKQLEDQAIATICQKLQKSLGISEDELQKKASSTLLHLLHNYSDFAISTIDKFILKVIRAFAIDLQIPFNFEIEMDSDSMIENAVDNVLLQAGKDPELTDFMMNFIEEQLNDDASSDVSFQLKSIADELTNENARAYAKTLKKLSFQDFLGVKKECQKQIKEYVEKRSRLIEQGKQIFEEKGLKASFFAGKSRSPIPKYFLEEKSKKVEHELTESASKYFNAEDWAHPDANSDEQDLVRTAQPLLIEIFQQSEAMKVDQGKLIALDQVSKHIFKLALLNTIDKEFEAIKKENNYIHISDFNKKLAEIVTEQPIPFVYERLGEKFKNYLIDEFQDTSDLQWQNLMPLIENSLAYGNSNLIVGDVKQAIYRWRGGDVEQFQNLGNDKAHYSPIVSERIGNVKRAISWEHLNTNYRSDPNIVRFNNALYESIIGKLAHEELKKYYEDVVQKIAKEGNRGYVELREIESSYGKKLDQDAEDLPIILHIIKDATNRNYDYKDICIICRTNEQLAIVGTFLTEKQIPIVSSKSLSLASSCEIQMIIALLRYINEPNNELSYVNFVQNYIEDLSIHEALSGIFLNHEDALIGFKKFLEERSLPLKEYSNFGIYELIETLIRTLELDKNDAFVQKFIDLLSQSKIKSVAELLDWWEEKSNNLFISSPEGLNAVQLMSVHKSKGLEFPVVIYPFANKSSRGNSANLWTETDQLNIGLPAGMLRSNRALKGSSFDELYSEEIQKSFLDELNTCYVATTRARSELYILTNIPENKGAKKKPTELIDSPKDFFTEIIHIMDAHEDYYSFGNKSQNPAKKLESGNIQEDHSPEFKQNSGWNRKLKLSFSAPKVWNVPHSTTETFIAEDPRTAGNLVHFVLSKTNKDDQPEEIICDLEETGYIHQNDLEQIKQQVLSCYNNKALQEVWNLGKHLIEHDFITAEGRNVRPDRVILGHEKTIVVDFKTGAHNKKYIKQLEQYKSIVKDVGYTNVEGLIIYSDSEEYHVV